MVANRILAGRFAKCHRPGQASCRLTFPLPGGLAIPDSGSVGHKNPVWPGIHPGFFDAIDPGAGKNLRRRERCNRVNPLGRRDLDVARL